MAHILYIQHGPHLWLPMGLCAPSFQKLGRTLFKPEYCRLHFKQFNSCFENSLIVYMQRTNNMEFI